MTYTYVLDTLGNKDIAYNQLETDLLYVLCYHINTDCKYPFLQFMLEKIPFCRNLMEEKLVLPNVSINNKNEIIQEVILEKVKNSLHSIGLETLSINETMYKGILFIEHTPYALVNVSELDISGIHLSRNSNYWFVLPTEIINTREVCGIPVDKFIVQLFIHYPQLAILTNLKTKMPYNLPDAVFTTGSHKDVEFNSIFGNIKTQVYDSCGSYYYFYNNYFNAVNQPFVSLERGINRYALFIEGELYNETEKEFSLTDTEIEHLYPDLEQCIIICYKSGLGKPNLLVRSDNTFVSLSFFQI